MSDLASDLLSKPRAQLKRQIWRRRILWAVVIALGLVVFMVLGDGETFGDEDASNTIGGFSLVACAVLAIIASRCTRRIEHIERSINDLKVSLALTNGDQAEADRLLAQDIHTAAASATSRWQDQNDYGLLFIAVGVFVLIYFGFELDAFLKLAATGEKSEAYMEDYESEVAALGLVAAGLIGWGVATLRNASFTAATAERLDVERELTRYVAADEVVDRRAAQARKLFLLNEQGLQRYYRFNRTNARWALILAAICVATGLGITYMALALMTGGKVSGEADVLVAIVGAAGTIMVNVVAAVVLRMQGSIWANVNSFHERLVRTHEMFLAHVIAAEIADEDKRNDTLSAIAAGLSGDRPKPGQKAE